MIEGMHEWSIESIGILVILGFNTIMGVWQEYRAEDALARLGTPHRMCAFAVTEA